MNLSRPLVFLDLETTGIDTKTDRIVEISMVKYYPNKSQDIKTRLINPKIPIPVEASEVHGIYDKDVQDKPSFGEVAEEILLFIQDTDLAGYNSNRFDIPLLFNEFERNGYKWTWKNHKLIDVGNIYKALNPRTLSDAYKHYTGKNLDDAHSAEADTIATKEILFTMIELGIHDESLGEVSSVEDLALFSNFGKKVLDLNGSFLLDDNNEVILNIGKYRGNPARNHLDFVSWMYSKDFPSDTLDICSQLLSGKTAIV